MLGFDSDTTVAQWEITQYPVVAGIPRFLRGLTRLDDHKGSRREVHR